MTDPVAIWHAEHMRFTQLLDFLEQQMAEFHAGGHPSYDLMRDVVYYLHHFADRFHHPREDMAFARMLEHDPGLEMPINRLLQEHRVIALAGDALLKYLDEILDDTFIERAVVEAAASTYLVYYRHHLATEENEILPRAAQLLMPGDWAAVADAVPAAADPLFGDDIAARYRDLRKQILSERQ